MEKQEGTTFLKVMSIIMIVGGVFEAIAGILSFVAVGALSLFDISPGILYFTAALVIVSAVIYLISGIVGLKVCKVPGNAGKCLVWGIVCLLLMLTGNVISGIWGDGFKVQNLITGMVLPGLYIMAAMRLQSK